MDFFAIINASHSDDKFLIIGSKKFVEKKFD